MSIISKLFGKSPFEPLYQHMMKVKECVDLVRPLMDAFLKGEDKKLTPDDQRKILSSILVRRGISFREFQLGVERQAYLRAIARKQVVVTDELLKEQYKRAYGPRRKLSAIVVNTLPVAQSVHAEVQRGGDFAELARKHSIDMIHGPGGGALGIVAPNDRRLPPVVNATAFEIEEGLI